MLAIPEATQNALTRPSGTAPFVSDARAEPRGRFDPVDDVLSYEQPTETGS